MPPQEGTPASGDEAQLTLERCPNCNGPLRFPADQTEAYCPACGIFVELLRPLSPTPSEQRPVEDNGLRLQTARLYLELDDVLTDEIEEETEEVPEAVHAESAASEVEPEAELAEEEGVVIPVPVEAPETDELTVAPEEAVPEILAEPSAATTTDSVGALPALPRRWHRVLFYSGSALVAFGGSGLALGSLLHDVFRVPFFGSAYDAFGNLNVSAVVFGAAFLLAGFAAMAVGALAGTRRHRAVGG